MLRAVTFDLWETLIHEDFGAESTRRDLRIKGVSALLEREGLKVDPEAWQRAHHEVMGKMSAYWSSNLDTSVFEQVRSFLELALGKPVEGIIPPHTLLECAKIYSEAALQHPPKVADGAPAVLQALRASGLSLALISNTGRTPGKVLRAILQQQGLLELFETVAFSDEARIRKPEKEIFLTVLKRLGVAPEDAAHVGDQPDTDLAGAQAAGMRTIYLKHAKSPEAKSDFTIAVLKDLPALLGKLSQGLDRDRTHFGHDTVAYE